MSNTTQSYADFANYPLQCWNDLVGNRRALELIRTVFNHPGAPPNLMICGPTGSGKSATVDHACRVLACEQPNNDEPCGECDNCQKFRARVEQSGAFVDLEDLTIHYVYLNCRNATLDYVVSNLKGVPYYAGLRIVHLEEAAGLRRYACDEAITEVIDNPDSATCRWVATCVRDHGLDEQFRRRFDLKVTTSPGTVQEVAGLIAKRCAEQQIEVDHPSTWELAAKRSWRIPAHALAPLAQAALARPRKLTREMVLEHPFPKTNPWDQEFFVR